MSFPLRTDSYKLSHWKAYHPDTEHVYSYMEARDGALFPEIVMFGLQMILERNFAGARVGPIELARANALAGLHFGSDEVFNREGWTRIIEKHGGRLPLRVRALREGTVAHKGDVLMTVENTDPEFPWLTNWAETMLMQVWYPITVATLSREVKKIIKHAMDVSGADPEGLPFKLHDFGFRGSTSVESAGIGGCAHLVNFMGTDTLEALLYARKYYEEPCAGFSIPATEHSIMTQQGPEGETEVVRRVLEEFPTGLVAMVGDSYDMHSFARDIIGRDMQRTVLERDGCLVVRPDSGDPATICTEVAELLWEAFGGELNQRGYKVLNPKVRMIQGDGIKWKTHGRNVVGHTAGDVLREMMNAGFSAENIAFGSGGGLLQEVTRDTLDLAIKCSATCINGRWSDVRKNPATQAGKASKGGRFAGDLVTVFENGDLHNASTLAEARERARV